MEEKSIINNIEVHVHEGGQVNVAQDNGHVYSNQYNNTKVTDEYIINLITNINSQGFVHSIKNGNDDYRKATENDVIDIPDSKIDEFKRQLGTRLNGSESKLEIISAFLREMDYTFQSGRRYDVMPIFSEIPRGESEGYIYLDECLLPIDNIKMQVYYWDAFERYCIDNKYYYMDIITYDGKLADINFGYNLSFPDVNERLYGFYRVEKLVYSEKIYLLISDENKRIEIHTKEIGENWQKQKELTNYWITQMKKIDGIEKYFKIKFHLPIKASDEDYRTIEILNESINKLSSSTFPPVSLEKGFLKNSFKISEEIPIAVNNKFTTLILFGYKFQPIAAYVMECTLLWKKKLKAMETQEGGVPVRIEFACNKE